MKGNFLEFFSVLKHMKTYFWPFLTKNTLNLVSLLSLLNLVRPMIAKIFVMKCLKRRIIIFLIFFRFLDVKNVIFGQKWFENGKVTIFWS